MDDALRRTTIAGALDETVDERTLREGRPKAESEAPMPDADEVVGGIYRLVRPLGQGAFGRVWAAHRLDVPEHQVALKLLRRSHYEGRNPERELKMLATVGHPNVVQLKDHGTSDDFVWLTMPVYEGETLDQRLERGPLGLREAYEIFEPIARGLDALHRAGLRHQDVKPENLFLARFGRATHPLVLDLGVAAERDADFVAGTILFAAPEQIQAMSAPIAILSLSEKMDTYGLAATILYSLVGPRAFPGERAKTREELARAHEERANRPLSGDVLLDLVGEPRAELVRAFRRWLAIEPEDRPSMSEVVEELDVLLEGERDEARREAEQRVRQRLTILRLRAAALVMVLGAAGFGAYVFSKRETLRLAGALETARAEGASSFDRLDTCQASYAMEKSDKAACEKARKKDQEDCQASLSAVAKVESGDGDSAKEIQKLTTAWQARLKACEDEEKAARDACPASPKVDAPAPAASDDGKSGWADEKKALEKQRDDAKKDAEKATSDLDVARKALDACLAPKLAPKAAPEPKPEPPAEEL